MNKKSFTFVEFLMLIAILIVIGGIVFIVIDPIQTWKNDRNSQRWQDVKKILNAIKTDQIDNSNNKFFKSIEQAKYDKIYMISNGKSFDCDSKNDFCKTNVSKEAMSGEYCLNLMGLVEQGYLDNLPVSPSANLDWTKSITGYTLEKSHGGIITIRACETEGGVEIWTSR